MAKTDTEPSRNDDAPLGPLPEEVMAAVEAARDKKSTRVTVLDLREVDAFTDLFVICTATNVRQAQAIADGIEARLREAGVRPAHLEGYERGEWILLDYFDFIVHVFTPATREFYALERLWGQAGRIELGNTA
jgi:ribosome-associated protein